MRAMGGFATQNRLKRGAGWAGLAFSVGLGLARRLHDSARVGLDSDLMRRQLLILSVAAFLTLGASEAGAQSPPPLYRSTWRAIHGYFEAPLYPAPKLVRAGKPGYASWIADDGAGHRAVFVREGFWRTMVAPTHASDRPVIREALTHEFAHIYQDEAVFIGRLEGLPFRAHGWYWSPRGAVYYQGVIEGCAEAFALWAARREFGPSRAYHRGGAYSEYVEEMRRDLPGGFLRRDQFAENAGLSARAVPFP
jgi:hypothetical protein